MITNLFTWIYGISYPTLIRWGIVLLFSLIFLHRRYQACRWWRPLLGALLLAWAAAVLWSTVFSRSGGGDYSLSVIPFHTYREVLNGGERELLRSNFMNTCLFLPAGVLLCLLLPDKCSIPRRILITALLCICLSFSIEFAQCRLALGHFQADDILHNTLGAMLGCAVTGAAAAPKQHKSKPPAVPVV